MPAWVFIVIPFLIEKLMQTFQAILNAYGLITDRFADSGFSLFVSLESENEKLKEQLLEQYYNWLRVAVNICPAHLFIIYNYEIIKADDDLKRFLLSDPYLKANYEAVKKGFEEGARAKDLVEFLKQTFIDTPLSFILGAIEQLITNPMKMFDEICNNLMAYINAHPTEEQVAISRFLSQFTPDKAPKQIVIVANEIIAKLNPFLAILSPQILAHIKAMYAYSKIIHYKQCPNPPRQLLEFLDCDVYVNNKHYATIKLAEDNTLAITIPKSKLAPFVEHEICFDYAGLKKCVKYKYGVIPRLTLVDFGLIGHDVCTQACTLYIGADMGDWSGNCQLVCTGTATYPEAIIWIEIEHNLGSEPFYFEIWAGAYQNICPGTTALCVGYRVGDTLYLTKVSDIRGTFINPAPHILYGSFPSPRFVIALYHYCPQMYIYPAGVRMIITRAWK